MYYDNVEIPKYLSEIKPLLSGMNTNIKIIGFDTETYEGKPICLQFWSNDVKIKNPLIWVNEKNVFQKGMDFFDSLKQDDSLYVVYALNLEYDMVSLFYPHKEKFLEDTHDFEHEDWKISGVFSSLHFSVFQHKNRHKKIMLLDISAFLKGSLKKLADLFCPELKKLEQPKDLGRKLYTEKNKKFIEYAIRDAEICFYIGKWIHEIHAHFDVPQCVSIAQMAAKIFRGNYVGKSIPLAERKITYAALHAYHGGKNNITVPAGMYKDVYSIDIISAYPYIMSQFPSFTNINLYKTWNKISECVPELGVYTISGSLKDCKYPILYDSNFKHVPHGDFSNIWITGYELNEALRMREIKLTNCYGYYYDAKKDKEPSPFKNFVAEFFEKKSTEKDKIKRHFYKIILNSLYGKFIQTVKSDKSEYYDIDNEKIVIDIKLKAGGLFNPFIAALITGGCRAYLHKIEHKYNALHSSTDGIIAAKKCKPTKGLGGLELEYEGDALILRNKLYIFYNKKGEKIKYALHGFHSTAEKLEEIWYNKTYKYEYIKPNKIKESYKRKLQVNKFEKREAKINIKGVTD